MAGRPINPTKRNAPSLDVKNIQDIYVRSNFKNLQDHFGENNQLLDFKFFELAFAGPVENFKLRHGLSITPKDVVVSYVTGEGFISFNSGLFDAQDLDISVTAACRIRFYVGTYWNDEGQTNPEKSEKIVIAANPSGISSALGSGTSGVKFKISSFIGNVFWHGSAIAPEGALLATGEAVSREIYADLFAVIGTSFGAGDGITTFNLPNGRGVSPRGTGSQTINGRVKTGPTLGGLHEDQLQSHRHADSGHQHWLANGGIRNQTATTYMGQQGVGGVDFNLASDSGAAPDRVLSGASAANIGAPTVDGANGAPRVGAETRVNALGLTACVWAFPLEISLT